MKVICEGRKVTPWWVGKRLECSTCGRVVELEEGDDRHCPDVLFGNPQSVVGVECTCGRTLFLEGAAP